MNVIGKFNGLNGAAISRTKIEKLLREAEQQEQYDLARRLSALLNQHPEVRKFTFDIKEPATENLPASMTYCFQVDDVNEDQGLNGVAQQDIYDMVTDMILNTIKKVGHLPWQKEWKGSGGKAAMNFVTKKPYTGINFIMLNFEQKEDEAGEPYLAPIKFNHPYYLTFKQIKDAKATLRKGSKASRVFYYTPIFAYDNNGLKIRTSDKAKFLEFIRDNGISPEDVKRFSYQAPVIKYYNVYRADDCDGLKFPQQAPRTIVEPIDVAQAIIDNYPLPPKYTFGGDGAFYLPAMDTINMPLIGDFTQPAFYYSTYFHEIIHSTGHSKRLDRGNDTRRRDGGLDDKKAYAFEELIAELGAVYLCSEAGILFSTRDNNAKYLSHWNTQLAAILKEDNRFFFRAAAAAQKGTNHVLDLNADDVPAYLRKAIKEVPELKKKEDISESGSNKKPTARPRKKKRDPQQLSLLGRKPEITKTKPGLGRIITENEFKEETEEIKKTNGLACPVPVPQAPAPAAPPKSTNPKVMKIGGTGQPSEYYTVAGEVGRFLQQVERKPVQSVVITMDGEQGAGKTTTLYKFIEGFSAPGNRCLFLCLEEHPESSLAKDKADRYLSPESAQRLDTVAEVDTSAELYDLIPHYDIIFIDSWQKLLRMIGAIRLDEDLRKRFDGKVFVIIFQQTTNGRTKGGAEVVFDGDIIIKMVKEDRFSDNYAYFDKNRYTKVPLETIRYNIAAGTCYNPEEPKEGAEEAPAVAPVEQSKLKYNVI